MMMDLRVSRIKEAKASSERSDGNSTSNDKTKTAMAVELPQADADDASVSTSSSSSSTVTATSTSTSSSQAHSELSARRDDLVDQDLHTSECNSKSAARHDGGTNHDIDDEETVCSSSSSSSSLSISSASVSSSSSSCASADDDDAADVGGRHHHMHDFQKRHHPSVSFNPQVRVRKIFIEDDCIVVPQEIWYDDIDYAAIKQESKDTIKIYKAGRLSDDDEDYCFRGLESRTKKGAKKRKELREKYRVTVLLEHMRQRYQRSIDEEELAIIACDLSLENQFEAYRRAVQDEQDVMTSIYNSDDSDSSSSDDDDESVL
eukprot:CAMPEP_0119546008 /NCGR_PEP_ID=MMETSP1352-20130426/596_1 /TAXON_ID=265584 /ORGANISM="Stauroneis constricta, Strain CCMP1120" /LENGTH=317 /DNA_ID=CAMNT_0007590657 /DNA_START=95 /DNA_END=1048 /DNA_ORIENTATION=+